MLEKPFQKIDMTDLEQQVITRLDKILEPFNYGLVYTKSDEMIKLVNVKEILQLNLVLADRQNPIYIWPSMKRVLKGDCNNGITYLLSVFEIFNSRVEPGKTLNPLKSDSLEELLVKMDLAGV